MIEFSRRDVLAGGAALHAVTGGAKAADLKEISMETNETGLRLPEQVIPVPTSISPQGQGYLAAAARRIAAMTRGESQAPSQAEMAQAAVGFLKPLAAGFDGEVEAIALPGGARLLHIKPRAPSEPQAKVAFLDIHGGGFTSGGGEMCELLAKLKMMEYRISVFSVDYRLAPEHPYPAALDDCVAAYTEVLKRFPASALVVGGASAGGNLAAALLLRARSADLPQPRALVLQTPALDLSRSSDSYHTNKYLDVNLYGGAEAGPAAYLGGHDPRDPFASPIYGELDGWPPTILTSGTRDLLLSDTVRMHRALRRKGVRAELHIAEASPHGGFMGAGAPEDQEIAGECRRFVLGELNLAP